jgi:hypothetical protein
MFAEMMVDDPPLEGNEYNPGIHSLTQLWGVDRGGNSDQEFGYGAAPGVFGDYYSHLFVSYEDGGVYPTPAFNPPGWVGTPESPYAPGNVVSTPGAQSVATFGIERGSNGAGGFNWYFYINGYWMGYFPESDWHRYFNTGWTEVAAGGEVASTSTSEPCAWMGDGSNGQQSNAAYVTRWSYVQVNPKKGSEAFGFISPEVYFEEGYPNYKEGNTEPAVGKVLYGGTGWPTAHCP